MRIEPAALAAVLATVLATVAGALPGQSSDPARTELAAAVDAFLLDRWSATGPEALVARWRAANVTADELEAMLRRGRPDYPEPTLPRGELSPRLPLPSDHLDHTTQHFVYVPQSYDKAKATPLVVIGHGGSAARDLDFGARAARGGMVPFWLEAAERHGFLLVAPLTDRGWMQIGTSLLFSAISRLQRDYHVDPDRICLTGHSMGGHLTWRSAFWFPDRWAAVSPMSGGYDYVKSMDVWNLIGVPGYTTFGTREPYQINEFNRTIASWMEAHRYPWTCREKAGGHTIFADEVVHVAAFFAAQRRDLYRKQLWARVGGLQFAAAESNPQWGTTHTWRAGRPIELSTVHWLRFRPVPAEAPPERHVQRVFAQVVGDNRIELTSENVRELQVLLHPKLVDLSRPVTIVANEVEVFRGVVPVDLGRMLALVREYDDRGRIFHAAVDVRIATDRSVPEPFGG
jgi:poly(3-hydroxybutyrate) depolymerase